MKPEINIDAVVELAHTYQTACGMAKTLMRGEMWFPLCPSMMEREAAEWAVKAKRSYDALVNQITG